MTDANTALLAKGKSKTKAKAADKVVEADLIATTAHTLENLTKDEAYALVPELTDSVDFHYFKLGGALAAMQGHDDWWKDDGYDNYRQFIEAKFGIQYRKAMYLISIYGALVESGVKSEQLGGLGWSKIKEIAAILTVDNVAEWVEKAKDLTVLQLHDAVKKFQSGSLAKSDETPEGDSSVTTFTVKVHADQKETIGKAVEKAMKEANTEFKGVALEAICLNYLSGAKVAKPLALKDYLAKYGYEDVLNAFAEVWPNIEITARV